jgi:hypothetical protein
LEITKLITVIKRSVNTLFEFNSDIYILNQRLYNVDETLGEEKFISIFNIFLSDGKPIKGQYNTIFRINNKFPIIVEFQFIENIPDNLLKD